MKTLRAVALTAVAATAFTPSLAHAAENAESVRANKASMASALSKPVFDCVRNTSHSVNRQSPLFNTCVDWHSAVHAYYALYATSKMSGNTTGASLADQHFSSGIDRELAYMRTKVVRTWSDNPYGFAWLLRTAMAQKNTSGSNTLHPLADYAAAQLRQGLQSNSARVDDSEYSNLSWTVISFADWARHTGNAEDMALAKKVVNERIKPHTCDPMSDSGTNSDGFFPTCLLRIAAVATVEGRASRAWVGQNIPVGFNAKVRPNTATGHSNALNFSRAFALSRIGRITERTDLSNNAAELLSWQVNNSRVWTTDFRNNSHWLAQFGVLALEDLTAGSTPAAQDDTPAQEKPAKPQPAEQKPVKQPAKPQIGKPIIGKPVVEKPEVGNRPGTERPGVGTIELGDDIVMPQPLKDNVTPGGQEPMTPQPAKPQNSITSWFAKIFDFSWIKNLFSGLFG